MPRSATRKGEIESNLETNTQSMIICASAADGRAHPPPVMQIASSSRAKAHPPKCACGCVPNIPSLFEMAEMRKQAKLKQAAQKNTTSS